jgi:transcriptional regulator with XRE-family HTH domain
MASVLSPHETCIELASRARQLRLFLGLGQRELAEKSGVAFSTLRAFERTGQISLERLVMLARVLNAVDAFESLFVLPPARSLTELERPVRQRGRRRPS